MTFFRFFLATACFIFLSLAHAAEREIVVMPLHNTAAEQLVPTVQNLLPEGATATAYGNQLILKVTADERAAIEQLIQQIDKPPRQLLISVRTPQSTGNSENSVSVSGSFHGGKVQLGQSSSNGQVIIRSNTNDKNRQGLQTIRVTEGLPAFISTGQSVPVATVRTNHLGERKVTTDYQAADQGFYVTARVVDNRVTLEIRQTDDQHQTGTIATQRISTQVSGPVGQWITIGSTGNSSTASQSGLVIRSSDASQRTTQIQLRVEELAN